MKSLRATAEALSEKANKTKSLTTSTALNADATDKQKDVQGAGKKCVNPKRGRPPSKTRAEDGKLYLDWKAANRETGITKKEFLRGRGLPESDLAAIERGRKQAEKRTAGKNSWQNAVNSF
jgi:hypothetical protein